MTDKETWLAMCNMRESDGWQKVILPHFKETRKSLDVELLSVKDWNGYLETKYAINALENLKTMIEIMGDPEREPELEDTPKGPSEGM